MKTFFSTIKNWIINHAPTKRRLIQVYAALLYNANLKGYISGQIYTGNTKYACVPGMNCYSCPGAVAACPLGALQNALASSDKRAAYYMLGILGLFGLIFARTICGFLCPVGLGQDLIYKIKSPKVRKNAVTRILSYLKYVLLVVLVIGIPVVYSIQGNGGTPGFCKTICPAGTFGGGLGLLLHPNNRALLDMLGPIFTWKFVVLVVILVAAVFFYRPFCRFICPLGAIYGFFNRIALIGVKLDKAKCTDCGLCVAHCKMDVKKVGDHECINCGECMSICPAKAITWKGSRIFLKGNEVNTPVPEEKVDIRTMRLDFGTNPPAPALATVGASSAPTVGAPSSAPLAQNKGEVRNMSDEATMPAPSSETNSNRKSGNKPIRKRGRGFWFQFAAWTTALVVLAVSLIYFNFIDVERISVGASANMKLPSINVIIDDKQTSLSSAFGTTSTTIILADDSDESVEIVKSACDSFALFKLNQPDVAAKSSLIALLAPSVSKSFVEDNGLANENITFASAISDEEMNKFIEDDQTTISYPTILSINTSNIVTNRYNDPDSENLYAVIQNSNSGHEVGLFIPNFSVREYGYDDNGNYARLTQTFNPYDHIGEVTVINFWATWCGPCVAEIPSFNNVAKEFPEVNVVAIHGDNREPEGERKYRNIASFITSSVQNSKDSWSDYKILFCQDNIDGNGRCLTYDLLGGSSTWPMTFIVGKDGKITFIRIGSIMESTLRNEVQKALNA